MKILVGSVMIFCSDRLIGYVLARLYFKQSSGFNFRATYSMNSTVAKAIVLGSSRASHHYIPTIMEDSLGVTCYNAGRDGSDIVNNYAFFKAILHRYTPETIVLDMSPKELYYTPEDYEKLSQMLPYYNTHPEIRNIINLKGPFEKYKLYSAIYPYNSQFAAILIGNLNSTNDPGIKTKGFLPLFPKMKKSIADNFLKDQADTIDAVKIAELEDICNTCRQKNIELFIVYSPVFSNAGNENAKGRINLVTGKYNIPFFDFSTDTSFDNHPECFKDNSHMNTVGATLFTKVLIKKIKLSRTSNDN